MGATDTINASNVDAVEQVREMTKAGCTTRSRRLGTKADRRAGLSDAAAGRHRDDHRDGASA